MFALSPDVGPPRLLRYVDDLPDNTIARLDRETNILQINKCLYEEMDKLEKHILIRTHAAKVILERKQEKEEPVFQFAAE